MFHDYIGWHIELSRRCPLACPACDRTLLQKSSKVPLNVDIDGEALKRFLPHQVLAKTKFILLQGNLGDPIYHPNFHELAEHFFAAQNLDLISNGIQSVNFWERVLEDWPSHATVTLSIDGLRDTNHIYRKNADWIRIQSLLDLIANRKRKCKFVWKFIAFEHNHHEIGKAEALAKSIGFDEFRLQRTRPLDARLDDGGVLKEWWSADGTDMASTKYAEALTPFCLSGDMHYISALGEYFPCCWWSGYYNETASGEENRWSPFSIFETSNLDAQSHFRQFFPHLNTFENSPDCCRFFCRKRIWPTGDMPNTQAHRKFVKFNHRG